MIRKCALCGYEPTGQRDEPLRPLKDGGPPVTCPSCTYRVEQLDTLSRDNRFPAQRVKAENMLKQVRKRVDEALTTSSNETFAYAERHWRWLNVEKG